jgi:sugar phosphate isomerase/epimerase
MKLSANRREFFRAAGLAAAGSLWERAAQESARPAGTLSSRPRFLIGCCAYSYAKHLAEGRMTMEDFIRKGVELGVHGVDLTTYWLKSTEPAYLASLRHLAYRNGVSFSGAAIRTDMCQADPSKRAQELEMIKHWVDATDMLGASHLRVFGGYPPEGTTEEQAIARVAEMMKAACDYAGKKGITLGIESHGGITAKASTMVEILRRVDSPFAGITLDISHFADNPYAQLEAAIPYATQAHIKDRFSSNKEPIDLERVFARFARASYKGYMSAEYEGDEDPMTGVPKLIEQIRSLCRKFSSV